MGRVLEPGLDPDPGLVHIRHRRHTHQALAMEAPVQALKLVRTLGLMQGHVLAQEPGEETAAAVERAMATARDVVTVKVATTKTGERHRLGYIE